MTWIGQPSREGIALFSVRIEFGEAQATNFPVAGTLYDFGFFVKYYSDSRESRQRRREKSKILRGQQQYGLGD
jgi:hypothetical protein